MQVTYNEYTIEMQEIIKQFIQSSCTLTITSKSLPDLLELSLKPTSYMVDALTIVAQMQVTME